MEKRKLTAHIETGARQNVSICSMTQEVVPRLLPRAAQALKSDAHRACAHHTVGAAGQTHAIQCPVERPGMDVYLRTQGASGCQARADAQDGIDPGVK